MFNRAVLRIAGSRYYHALRRAERTEKMDPARLQQIQQEKFRRMIRHCALNVPYYRSISAFHHVSRVSDIGCLPFLSKDIIRSNYDRLIAKNMDRRRQRRNSTSGSTGEALRFLTDTKTDPARHAAALLGEMWTGYRFGEKKLQIWGAVQDVNRSKRLKSRLAGSSLLFNTRTVSGFHLSEADILSYLNDIERAKPSVITGYPSTLTLISETINAARGIPFRPKGIIASGEALQEDQRQTIQDAFKCKVLNRYGCRDIGPIAHECEFRRGLHIFSDHVVLEVVDENGNPCGPGKPGEIVLTDLDNHVFPFIRYRIGDRGIMTQERCACGRSFPLLKRVEGRIMDIIVGTNGTRVQGTYFSLLLRHRITGVRKFQILQDSCKKLTVNIIPGLEFTGREKETLVRTLKEKLGHDMDINVALVTEIPLTVSGKFRWIVSRVPPVAA